MQLGTLKIKVIVCASLLGLLTTYCKKENLVTIKINSIDGITKLPRINKSDTIEIRMVTFGYLKKNSISIGEYITDSTGSIKVKLDSSEEYHISLYGTNVFGWADYKENDLKDGQELIIEASSPENR